jgi:hypothetical protein
MRFRTVMFTMLCVLLAAPLAAARARSPQDPQKDYLTDAEADKIRDAVTPPERIKLYISFADDRLKKFQYELTRTRPEGRRAEILNGLLNDYVGCMDDAADQIEVARDKQIDIRGQLKLIESKGKEFLEILQKIDHGGPELDTYKDTLQDAIEGTQDAISDANAASKELTPVPVRRKPS